MYLAVSTFTILAVIAQSPASESELYRAVQIPIQRVSDESTTTQLAVSNDAISPSKFTFKFGDEEYTVLSDGKSAREQPGRTPEKFVVPVNSGAIEKVQYVKVGGSLILIYELNDGESGWGILLCMDRKTLKIKWQNKVPGFNVGQGLVEDSFLYLTAIGFVAKLDLRSGRYVWKHNGLYKPGFFNSEGLYEPAHFNDFQPPQSDGELVLFQESTPRPHDDIKLRTPPRAPITLRVNKKTGKMLAQ